jgi:catechol 2,3-dioxygenase-like lactoylglutathione lyase family enzyme
MDLNHVTLPAENYESSRAFYLALGLNQIVAAPPRYARFECPNGATISFEVMEDGGNAGRAEIYLQVRELDTRCAALAAGGLRFEFGPRDENYLWRRAGLTDPAGNRIILYDPGRNQRFPPWRIDGLADDPAAPSPGAPDADLGGPSGA